MRPRNILMFTPYYPPHTGGVEYYSEELGYHLAQSDCFITILTAHLPVTTEYRQQKNIKIIPYPAFEIIHNYPIPKFWKPEFWKILATQKQNCPDIVITHTRFFCSSIIGSLFARFVRIPHLHIEHGSSFVQSKNPLIFSIAWIYDHLIGRYILHRANSIVAISESVKDFLKTLVPKTQIEVLYRGFETKKIESISVNESFWKKHDKKLKLLFIGRLVSSKGSSELIDALTKFSSQDWVCVFVGDGEEREKLASKIKFLNLQEKVFLVGPKPWNETIGILKGADILINPSHTEGLPTTVLEATLCGIPTIATDVGGTREISSFITLVPPKNSKYLAEAITETSKKIEQTKYSYRQVTAEAKEKFSWKASIPRFLSLIDSLLP